MSNKQETIVDIVAEMRLGVKDWKGVRLGVFDCFADRIEAAHKREVAELLECLREAVTEVCNRLEKCGFKEPCVFKTCYVQKWRKALKDEGGAEWMV